MLPNKFAETLPLRRGASDGSTVVPRSCPGFFNNCCVFGSHPGRHHHARDDTACMSLISFAREPLLGA